MKKTDNSGARLLLLGIARYQGGSAEEDWFRAEEELRNRHAEMRMPERHAPAAFAPAPVRARMTTV